VFARFSQRRRELFVLRLGPRQLALGLEQALLERPDALRGILEAAAEDDDLFFEALHHFLELVDLRFVLGQPSLVLGSHETDHLLVASGP
jgi:hypothetical protein